MALDQKGMVVDNRLLIPIGYLGVLVGLCVWLDRRMSTIETLQRQIVETSWTKHEQTIFEANLGLANPTLVLPNNELGLYAKKNGEGR